MKSARKEAPSTFIEQRRFIRVGDGLFYISILASLTLMITLTRPALQNYRCPHFYLLDTLTYLIDPLLLNAISLLLLAYSVYMCFAHKKDLKQFQRYIWSIAIPGIVVLLAYFLGDELLKHVFVHERPPVEHQLGEPWLTRLVVPHERVGLTSCPSGFVFRQLFILLTCLLLCNQNPSTLVRSRRMDSFITILNQSYARIKSRLQGKEPTHIRPHQRFDTICTTLKLDYEHTAKIAFVNWCIILSQIFIFLFILFSRFYRGAHSLSDIGISLGSATYLFWIFVSILLWKKQVDRRFVPDMEYVSLVYLPLFYFYSMSAVVWICTAFVIISGLSLMYIYPSQFEDAK